MCGTCITMGVACDSFGFSDRLDLPQGIKGAPVEPICGSVVQHNV